MGEIKDTNIGKIITQISSLRMNRNGRYLNYITEGSRYVSQPPRKKSNGSLN
jgi:hypothetical protein